MVSLQVLHKIEREFIKFQDNPPWGIELFQLQDENLFEYVAKLRGLKNTIWEGGLFRIYIKFNEDYNTKPPSLCFHTIPFHPNIDAITGQPCLDILDNENWDKDMSLDSLLLSIQSLLSNPNLRQAVNLEALYMIDKSPKRYRQVVANCVSASQKFEETNGNLEGINSTGSKTKIINENKSTKTAGRKISKLSFEDYYTTWCGIATSKAKPADSNPLLEHLRGKPELQKTHMALHREDIEEQIKKQIEEHTMLMYGRFNSKPTFEEEKAVKLDKLQKMKRIYLPPRVSPSPASQEMNVDSSIHQSYHHSKEDEPWEKEVDDLVAWTNNLDSTAIDT